MTNAVIRTMATVAIPVHSIHDRCRFDFLGENDSSSLFDCDESVVPEKAEDASSACHPLGTFVGEGDCGAVGVGRGAATGSGVSFAGGASVVAAGVTSPMERDFARDRQSAFPDEESSGFLFFG